MKRGGAPETARMKINAKNSSSYRVKPMRVFVGFMVYARMYDTWSQRQATELTCHWTLTSYEQ